MIRVFFRAHSTPEMAIRETKVAAKIAKLIPILFYRNTSGAVKINDQISRMSVQITIGPMSLATFLWRCYQKTVYSSFIVTIFLVVYAERLGSMLFAYHWILSIVRRFIRCVALWSHYAVARTQSFWLNENYNLYSIWPQFTQVDNCFCWQKATVKLTTKFSVQMKLIFIRIFTEFHACSSSHTQTQTMHSNVQFKTVNILNYSNFERTI